MTRVSVQMALGYSALDDPPDDRWTDITEWTDIQSSAITITRGAEDEKAQTQTGTCTLALDNQDGRFTPGRPGPYFPYVRKRTPLRVRVTALPGTNWLTTTDFELDTGDWFEPDGNGPGNFDVDGAHFRSGTQSMLIEWDTTGTGGAVAIGAYGLTIGQQYTASGYVWVPAGSPAVRLLVGSTLGALSTTTGTWTRISVTWTATAGSHILSVTTGTTSPGAGSKAWLDDVMVNEGVAAAVFDATPSVVSGRFYGAVTSLPVRWKGLQSVVSVTCSDLFAWLGRQPALQPVLVEEVLLTAPIGYWTLSEAEGATSAGDISGYSRPALAVTQVGAGGTLTFGQGTGPATNGLPTPLFAPASSTAGLVLTADMGRALDAADQSGARSWVFECWFSTTTKGRVLTTWQASDPIAFDNSITFLLDATSGALVIETRDGGNLTTTTISTGNLADGATHYLVYDDRPGPLGTGQYALVDGVAHSITPVNQRIGLRRLTVGGYNSARLWSGSISHVAIYQVDVDPSIDPSTFLDHYAAGVDAFDGEAADTRMGRLLAYAGVALDSYGDFSAVAQQGELGQNVVSHLRDLENTESGKVFADRAAASVVFQSRTVRYNPQPALTIPWADTETDDDAWADDDQKQVNTVSVSRPGGAVQRVADADSIAAYGPYPPQGGDLTLLKMTDAEALDAATWIISRYAVPPPELRDLVIEAYSLPPATYAAVLGADISTVLTVTDLPDQAPTPTAAVFAEGYVETISEKRHQLAFHTSTASVDSVWVLDDPDYSVLGASTRLAY